MVGTNEIKEQGLVHHVHIEHETATFGMGCFWGADALFGATHGVLRTKVGYACGTTPNPQYKSLGDHIEVVSVDYDPSKTSYSNLLDLFWNNHEYGLTTLVKRQYSSIILYHTDEQKEAAEKSLERERSKRTDDEIITQIIEAEIIYEAEDYHQKYYLQSHKDFVQSLDLDAKLLITSHVAAKLNGYLVGVGGVKQYLDEADYLGLSEAQKEYVRQYVEENEGGSLYC